RPPRRRRQGRSPAAGPPGRAARPRPPPAAPRPGPGEGSRAASRTRRRRPLAPLGDHRDPARRRLLGGMAQEKYAVLLDDLVAAAAAPALLPGADRPAAEVRPPLVARPWKKLRKEVRKAGDDPPDEQLHQIRIRAKRARYAAEAVDAVIVKPAETCADDIADRQSV